MCSWDMKEHEMKAVHSLFFVSTAAYWMIHTYMELPND